MTRLPTERRRVLTSDGDRAAATPAPARPLAGGRVALAQFALSSLALVLVVGTVGSLALRRVAKSEAVHDATTRTVALSRGAIRERVTERVLQGDPAAIRELDQAMRALVLVDPIVRVKLWTPDGHVVYSDATQLIGRRFGLPSDIAEALRENAPSAEVSDLSRPENRYERGQGRLVEVYVPLRAPGGARVLVEAYHSGGSIDSGSHRIWKAFLPALLAMLAVLAAAQLPLAWILALRVRTDAQARERLSHAADEALETERRRIAAELHDGVVQDLAGMALDLDAAADRLPASPAAGFDPRETLRRGSETSRRSMRALRVLLTDLFPAERRHERLGPAIQVLAEPLRDRGLEVTVDATNDGQLSGEVTELLYRGAQEALRNVQRHAAAQIVRVTVRVESSQATLLVEDDGDGMTTAQLRDQRAVGHMGLALLSDRFRARGGEMSIESEPGSGTRVRMSLPC